MRRIAPLLALLLLSSPALGQGLNTGHGLQGTKPNNRLSTIPADQFLTVTYPWAFAPVGTDNGWFVQQTTAGGVTIAAASPFLVLTGATANRRVLVAEFGTGAYSPTNAMNVTSDGEATVAVSINGLDLVGATTTGWFQLAFGDTTNWIVDKIPHSGFGVLMTGSTSANNAYAQTATLTAYVANNSDTTYVPISSNAAANIVKLFIHADPGGGAVTFWVNDVLQATITSPVRSTDGSANAVLWENGAAGLSPVIVGPLTVQRAWP